MEKTEEEIDQELYIELSRKKINNYLYTHNYRSAFLAFVLVLERLDSNQKNKFINYYSDNLLTFMSFSSHLDDRNMQPQVYEV